MYRGGINQIAYFLHRITGAGVVLFLLIHIIDTTTIFFGSHIYNKVVSIFHNPFFKVMEVLLGTALIFHALNGLRIIIFDLFLLPSKYADKVAWIVVAITVFSFFIFSYYIL